MDKIFEALKDGGYIIAEECEVQNEQLGRLGLNICFSRVIDGNKKILLLRKVRIRLSNRSIFPEQQ